MHLGDGGVIVLEKQLNTSQTTNSHLEKKIQTQVHSMKNSAKNQKLLIQKYEILKQKYTPLLASNEKSHEELLVWKDNTIHLQHDVDRLNSQLLTLQHDKEVRKDMRSSPYMPYPKKALINSQRADRDHPKSWLMPQD